MGLLMAGSLAVVPSARSWAETAPVAEPAPARVAQANPAETARPKLDVPYVPTPMNVVEEMLRLTNVNKNDMVYDLGCGDGRIVVTAAKEHGARGLGVDIDPERIRESRENAKEAGVTDKVQFLQKDLFTMDIRPATVMTMYLLPSVNLKLRPKLFRDLRPGTRIVSHDFDMGSWQPDKETQVSGPFRQHNLYYWVIPANAAGEWTLQLPKSAGGQKRTLRLRQRFQQVSGTMSAGDRTLPIRDAKMTGDRLTFTVADDAGNPNTSMTFEGRVNGSTLKGNLVSRKGSAITKSAVTARRTRAGAIELSEESRSR
ncbi:MAG: class I SAM-dependent methyltransferase [Armatimonadetes bacterium]|nr:class I SAM-dependent methyltransferase [Armatimonadota bacterium]